MTKRYEIALLFGSYEYDNVQTYEYDTIEDMKNAVKDIMAKADCDLYKIELSVLEQDEDGENITTCALCDIFVKNIIEEKQSERV